MQIKKQLLCRIEKNKRGHKLLHDIRYRILFTAVASLSFNIGYAVYNGVLGFALGSLWFASLCAYYIILSVMRFAAVSYERKNNTGLFVMRFTGVMLIILSLVLSGSVWYGLNHETAKPNGEIVMITIAAYTFYKLIIAIINAVKVRNHNSPTLTTIRNIACADAAASILSLQRSMLVSFKKMGAQEINLMNTLTGIVICLFVFTLGLTMALGIAGGQKNGKIKNNKSKRKNRRNCN